MRDKTIASYILLALLIIVLNHNIYAGTVGTLVGTVVDKESKEPLPGVNILILGTHFGAATGKEGKFIIHNIPAGVYRIKASLLGFTPYIVENVAIIMDLRTNLDIQLEASVLELGREVVVRAERPLIQQDITSSTHSITGDKIEEMPIDSFKDVVMLQPGATADGHIRGGRETEVLYLVDDLPIQEAIAGGQGSDLPNASIVEMTVQTGGFNAEYGNAMSGIVNIVTKSGGDDHKIRVEGSDDRVGIQESNHTTEVEVLASGPLRRGTVTYFLSSNVRLSDTRWHQHMTPVFGSPIEKNYNSIGKVNVTLSPNLRLTTQILYSYWDWREYEFRWYRNLEGLPPRQKWSYRLSATLTHTLSPKTFYKLSLSHYTIHDKLGEGDKEDLDLNQAWEYERPFNYFVIQGERLWWQDAKENISILKGDISRQIGDIHLLKCGAEFQYFDLEKDLLKIEHKRTFWGRTLFDENDDPIPLEFSSYYKYRPWQLALYVQDKMDNEWFAANIGLRYDLLDPRAKRPLVEWVPTTETEYEHGQSVKAWVPAGRKSQISPRIGFSFPVIEKGFFFFNFGYFFQIPLFDYLYTGLDFDLKKGARLLFGDPDLKPERTKAYEFSYKHELRQDLLGSITYFQKETSNLIDTKTFLNPDSKAEEDGFVQYVNLPYAESKGWELILDKKYSHLTSGKLSYTYMTAKGFSANAEQGLNYFMWGFEIPNEMYYLSWDQRHTVVLDLFIGVPQQWGANVVWRWHSPRPYTKYPSEDGLLQRPDEEEVLFKPNNERMESVTYLDIKFTKDFRIGRSLAFMGYVDVRNLFDRKNLLWVAADGEAGGELGDPSAWDVGRRVTLGVKFRFGSP
ncbi:MAG: TonB-dependent receptor [Gemmatimonadota bacterium]|nr:MAG: TonB-dependent receptor [Gemmatimonadota bacterium]